MRTNLSTKERLLKTRNLLKKHTDEFHEVTIRELVDLFQEEYEQDVSIKAVRDDIKELASSGLFDVIEYQPKNGMEKTYSHQTRLFEIHELRVLIDAVSAARFITVAETEKLIKKLKELTSVNLARQLENRILLSEGTKTENKRVKRIIHGLHEAVWERSVIQFQYGKYDLGKEFQLNRNGDYYCVKPYAVIWNHDNYYLIGEYERRGYETLPD